MPVLQMLSRGRAPQQVGRGRYYIARTDAQPQQFPPNESLKKCFAEVFGKEAFFEVTTRKQCYCEIVIVAGTERSLRDSFVEKVERLLAPR